MVQLFDLHSAHLYLAQIKQIVQCILLPEKHRCYSWEQTQDTTCVKADRHVNENQQLFVTACKAQADGDVLHSDQVLVLTSNRATYENKALTSMKTDIGHSITAWRELEDKKKMDGKQQKKREHRTGTKIMLFKFRYVFVGICLYTVSNVDLF